MIGVELEMRMRGEYEDGRAGGRPRSSSYLKERGWCRDEGDRHVIYSYTAF